MNPVRKPSLDHPRPRRRAFARIALLALALTGLSACGREGVSRTGAPQLPGRVTLRLTRPAGAQEPIPPDTLTLAAFAGGLAAPVIQVNPVMGSNLIIVVFAVVVIGGMGSIAGALITGLGLGVIEGLTKVIYPEASAVVIFVIMIVVLLFRPAGLFGKQA